MQPKHPLSMGGFLFWRYLSRYNGSMNNNSNNCGDCGTICSECGRPWAICKQDGGCGCNKCKDIKFCEYGRMANGCIREKQPGCPMQAVIPSVTIESIEGIKNLADCLVHVSDINTTFYIDDKHRPIITWAGPIDIPGYDMEGNPNNYRDQIVTDVANQEAVIYDKSGRGYVFGLVENIDLQEQVNNKLDEMAEDGTLANLLNVPAINQKLSILPEMFVECTKVTSLGVPSGYTGAYAQSMDFDGTYWYVLYTDNSDHMIIRKYNSDFSNMESQTQLSVNGHGNSMCIFNNRIYISNYTTNTALNILDKSDLSLIKTVTLPTDVRGFAITEDPASAHAVVIGMEKFASGQLRIYTYLPDGNMQFIGSYQSEYTYTYRNGCKFITDSINNNRFLFASICGNSDASSLSSYKGNTIEFWIPGTDRRFKVGLLGSGQEVQDLVHPANNSNVYYFVNSAGDIYTANINLFSSSTNLAFVAGATQTCNNVTLYSGNKAKMTALGHYDSFVSGQSSLDVCTEFLTTTNFVTILGCFRANGGSVAVGYVPTTSTIRASSIIVPLKKTHSYNGKLYEIDGYLSYDSSEVNIQNPATGNNTFCLKWKLGGNIDVRIKETTLADGSITFNRYQTYSSLATRVTTDGIGFVFGDVYPIYLYSPGQNPNGTWERGIPDMFD